jgi:hypothetical protein
MLLYFITRKRQTGIGWQRVFGISVRQCVGAEVVTPLSDSAVAAHTYNTRSINHNHGGR